MSQIILDSANDLIQGDFDNATLTQRTRLQTSTVNATTGVYIIPNGTANAASVQISNNSNVTNASKVVLATNGSTDTQIISGANGSGTYLPLSIYTNNDIRLQVNNSGALGVRTGPGTVGFGTSGQVLTSNGSGAGVSWNTAAAGGFSNMQVFTSPGTFTTPASTTQIKVTVVGAGGGITSGGGGGGGGAAIYVGPVTASTPYAVTVGAGGTGTGGTSSFGSLASATGGVSTGTQSGGAGGAGSTGTLLLNGSGGGARASSPTSTATGTGGSSIFAAGALGLEVTAGNSGGGVNGLNYGGGASGRVGGVASNANGGGGVVVVEW